MLTFQYFYPISYNYAGKRLKFTIGGILKKYYYILGVLLVFSIVNPLFAQKRLIRSVGGGAGISLSQGDWDPGFILSAQANFEEVLKYIYLSPFFNYSTANQAIEHENLSEDLSINYLSIGAKIIGYLNARPKGFYIGSAISFNIISFESLTIGQYSQNTEIREDNTTKVGFAALAGYLYPLKSISIFIESDYTLVPGGYNNFLVYTGIYLNL